MKKNYEKNQEYNIGGNEEQKAQSCFQECNEHLPNPLFAQRNTVNYGNCKVIPMKSPICSMKSDTNSNGYSKINEIEDIEKLHQGKNVKYQGENKKDEKDEKEPSYELIHKEGDKSNIIDNSEEMDQNELNLLSNSLGNSNSDIYNNVKNKENSTKSGLSND